MLIVYVDDIILIKNYEVELTKLKGILAKGFETRDLENLKYFFEIGVAGES